MICKDRALLYFFAAMHFPANQEIERSIPCHLA
jgi:hypothetical protein